MPSYSIRAALAATVLATTASLTAAVPTAAAAAPAETAAAAQQGNQPRFISIRGVEPRNDVFFIKGRVQPSYERRVAVVQRKIGRSGRWRTFSRIRTTRNSGYRERVAPLRRVGRVYYRVKVRGTGNFRTSYSDFVFIQTSRG